VKEQRVFVLFMCNEIDKLLMLAYNYKHLRKKSCIN